MSPRGSLIGCEPRFMKRRSQVRIPPPPIIVWTCQKKKKKNQGEECRFDWMSNVIFSNMKLPN
jgi:hypothetical protein